MMTRYSATGCHEKRARVAAAACVLSLFVSAPATATAPLVEQPPLESKAPLVLATDEQTEPVAPEPWRPPPPRRWHDGVAAGVSFGAAFVEGLDQGYYGRIEIGGYDIQTRRRGFIIGMLTGLEGWAAKTQEEVDKGGSVPLLLYGGLQSDAFFSTLGAGFDVLLIDQAREDTGVGLFAPLAAAHLGFDLEGVRFLADARVGYRWQLGAADRSILRVGGTLQLTTD